MKGVKSNVGCRRSKEAGNEYPNVETGAPTEFISVRSGRPHVRQQIYLLHQ